MRQTLKFERFADAPQDQGLIPAATAKAKRVLLKNSFVYFPVLSKKRKK
jgi:hypothetical protein